MADAIQAMGDPIANLVLIKDADGAVRISVASVSRAYQMTYLEEAHRRSQMACWLQEAADNYWHGLIDR